VRKIGVVSLAALAAAVALVASGCGADRVLAARGRYLLETRFYDQLHRLRPVYRLDSGTRYGGPWVALYRLYP